MKITYKQIVDAQNVISRLLMLSPPPTARIAAQIARNVRKLEGAVSDFNEAKNAMLKPHLDTRGRFDHGALDEETQKALDEEYTELLETEVEVDIHPIKIADLEAIEQKRPDFAITTGTFFVAGFLFDD